MSPDYLLCDVCGAKVPEADRAWIPVGRSPDPAGGPSEDDCVQADLCGSCWRAVVRSVLRHETDYRLGNKIVSAVKTLQNDKKGKVKS